jgi:hypothetical protein
MTSRSASRPVNGQSVMAGMLTAPATGGVKIKDCRRCQPAVRLGSVNAAESCYPVNSTPSASTTLGGGGLAEPRRDRPSRSFGSVSRSCRRRPWPARRRNCRLIGARRADHQVVDYAAGARCGCLLWAKLSMKTPDSVRRTVRGAEPPGPRRPPACMTSRRFGPRQVPDLASRPSPTLSIGFSRPATRSGPPAKPTTSKRCHHASAFCATPKATTFTS